MPNRTNPHLPPRIQSSEIPPNNINQHAVSDDPSWTWGGKGVQNATRALWYGSIYRAVDRVAKWRSDRERN